MFTSDISIRRLGIVTAVWGIASLASTSTGPREAALHTRGLRASANRSTSPSSPWSGWPALPSRTASTNPGAPAWDAALYACSPASADSSSCSASPCLKGRLVSAGQVAWPATQKGWRTDDSYGSLERTPWCGVIPYHVQKAASSRSSRLREGLASRSRTVRRRPPPSWTAVADSSTTSFRRLTPRARATSGPTTAHRPSSLGLTPGHGRSCVKRGNLGLG
jgi:hypothetical protein